jgi:predicted MFS family arabinose efflux permease
LLAAVSTSVFFLLHGQHPRKNEVDRNEQPVSPIEAKRLWRKPFLWAGFLTAVTLFMSLGRSYIPTFLDEQIKLSEFHVGLFGSINFAGMTFIGIAIGHLSDKWRKSGAISLCLLLYTVSIVPLLLVRETFSLLSIAFILGGSAVSGSLVSSFVGTIAPQAKQGLWVSIPQTFSFVASFVAPYIGGYLYSLSPYYAFVVSVSGIPFLALFALIRLRD